jgi:hypothetical protein
VVVYSRCERDPALRYGGYFDYYPVYESGQRCRLYSIRLAASHPVEKALSFGPRLAALTLAEPTIWRRRIAFATSGRVNGLYVAPANGGHARRLRGGPVAGHRRAGVRGTDLRQGQLAFVWSQHKGHCGGHGPEPRLAPYVVRDAVMLESIRTRRPITIDVACDDSFVRALRRPAWFDNSVYYTALTFREDLSSQPLIREFDARSNSYRQAELTPNTYTLQYAPGAPALTARYRYGNDYVLRISEVVEVEPSFAPSERLDPSRHQR